jgi:hypothetical protein
MSAYPPTQGLFPNNVTAARTKLGLEIDLKLDFGASGSNQTTTGSIDAGSNVLLVSDPIDFVDGQGISIIGAGPGPFRTDGVTPLSAPASLTVTPNGGTSSTHYKYYCAAIDAKFGVTATVSQTITNGRATLDSSHNNSLSVPAVTGAAAYVWWGDNSNPSASRGILGITSGNSLSDIGAGNILSKIPNGDGLNGLYYLPITPPSSAVGDVLITSVSSGSGTYRLTLADYATKAVTSAYVGHSDYQAFVNAVTSAIATGRKLRITAGNYIIDNQVVTDVSPGADLLALNMYGFGNETTGLEFYMVTGIPWNIKKSSASIPIYGMTIKNMLARCWSWSDGIFISDSGGVGYYNCDIDISIINNGNSITMAHIYNSNVKIECEEYGNRSNTVYIDYSDDNVFFINATISDSTVNSLQLIRSNNNIFIGGEITGRLWMQNTNSNIFIGTSIETIYRIISSANNMMVNCDISNIDAIPTPVSLIIVGGLYDNYSPGSAGTSANNTALTTTNPTTVLTYAVPAAFNQALEAKLSIDVITAATTVTATLSWTNPNTGAQTFTWENAASLPVGTRLELPVPFLAQAGTTVTLTVTAGTANQVFVTGCIEKIV